MKKGKKITIENLAGMVKNGFDNITDRFDNRITGLEKQMNERFDQLEFKIGGHDNRISNLEDKVLIISKKVGLSK